MCSCVPYLCVRVIATQGDCNEKEVGVKQVLIIGLEYTCFRTDEGKNAI